MKDKLLNANFPKTAEGRVYHVEVKRGEVANRIITVGDPSRAQLFAEWLDKDTPIFRCNSARGFFTLTGKYKGVPVSIMGIGMVLDGQLIIIRFGSCGTIGKGTVGHMVVPKGAFAVTKNFDYFYNYYEDPDMTKNEEKNMKPYNVSEVFYADQEICELLKTKLLNYLPANEIHTGLNATCDSFYSSQGREDDNFADHNKELLTYIKKKHPQAESLEMETFMLYHLAKCSNDALLIKRKKSITKERINEIDKMNENKTNLEIEIKYDENIITTIKKPKNSIRAAATMMIFADRKTDEFIDSSRKKYLETIAGLAVLDVLVSIKLEEEQENDDNEGVWNLIN
ncbi:3527_t:CDS:2 [Diversispora eburnea]|uniref:3527_t:CDS:1 n=1 Tax=Diversispora eburnea TaxID=1213867 RepID=A0A9N9ART1_9GLOM|nr:3527_t:CDS:2 [Diversispora eburnea]